jgi:KaiC/GvpD/RAD55 family RecA-like ATPase
MDNLIINNNVLETVNQVIEIIRREEETERERAVADSMSRVVKNMYNKHHRLYMNDNPEKRKAIQLKYRQSHPKTEEQKERDREYARLYYLKKKEEKNRGNGIVLVEYNLDIS